MMKETYKYNISGYYKVNGTEEEKYFNQDIEATSNTEAIEMVLGKIAWKESLEGDSVMFDRFHYEVD